MYWLTFPNGRVVEWGMSDGTHKAPLVFRSRELAMQWKNRVALAKRYDLKPKQCPKPHAGWYWDGKYLYEGPVSAAQIEYVGHICHEQLSPESEQVCREVYASVGRFLEPSFEQWELGFLRETNPEQELRVWQAIAESFAAYTAEHPDCEQLTAICSFVAISLGGEDKSLDAYRPYYLGPIKPLVLSADPPVIQFQMCVSTKLCAVMPRDEIEALTQKWTEKAMAKACPNPCNVSTECGEVVLRWDWERIRIEVALATEYESLNGHRGKEHRRNSTPFQDKRPDDHHNNN